ncbi:hypothetical protein ACLEC0_00795 [Lonsdalea quercina]|uniref:hypothetical protein n=1 Tax=Lonsdalea quercina TaxID=71657 RepID=UPI0039755006
MNKATIIIMIAVLLSSCAARERASSIVTAPQPSVEKANTAAPVKTEAQLRDEENRWIKSSLKDGIPATDENLRRYCRISSTMIEGAILDLFGAIHGSKSINIPDDARYINFTREQYLGLINHGMEDRNLMWSLQDNPMAAISVSNMYNLRCQSYPEKYIFNYSQVFHSHSRKSSSKIENKTAPQTVDEIARSIDEQRRMSVPASN